VHFFDVGDDVPCAAIIAHVWNDRLVNLAVFDENGDCDGWKSVVLCQPEDMTRPGGIPFCEWMPYQVKKDTGSESGEKAIGTQAI